MTDDELKSALIEIRDCMLLQFPTSECDHEFSVRFQRRMKQIIEMEKHPVWFHVRKIAVALIISLGIAGGLAIGFSEEVRADVRRWFMERFSENEYRYQNNMGIDIDISGYTLEGKVLDGYQLVDRMQDENQVSEVYVNENGAMLIFAAMNSLSEEDLYVSSDQSIQPKSVFVKGVQAELYLSERPGESNAVVWQKDNGVLFSIQGILSKEELIDLAERID